MEPPYWYYPVRQTLGAVLTLNGEHQKARDAFRESLQKVPNNGWALYVVDGRPAVAFSLFGELHGAAATMELAPGRRLVRLGYERARGRPAGGGPVHLDIDGERVAELELPHDLPFRWQIGGAGLHIGADRGFPVADDYDPPFPFTGTIDRVEIEIPQFAPRPDDAARRSADVAQALRHE